MKKKLIILWLTVVTISCAKETGETLIPSIKVNQKLETNVPGVSLVMDSVLNDSRCPSGVQCVWQGNASVRFNFSANDAAATIVLNTTISPRDTVLFGYEIKLIGLTPEPAAGKVIHQSDYSAQVEVNKK